MSEADPQIPVEPVDETETVVETEAPAPKRNKRRLLLMLSVPLLLLIAGAGAGAAGVCLTGFLRNAPIRRCRDAASEGTEEFCPGNRKGFRATWGVH